MNYSFYFAILICLKRGKSVLCSHIILEYLETQVSLLPLQDNWQGPVTAVCRRGGDRIPSSCRKIV